MMQNIAVMAAVVVMSGLGWAQGAGPERVVSGTTIRSAQDPKVVVTLPKDAVYVGVDRWVLYGVADCELHLFVEADAQKKVQRLYWVQFEGYIPSRPELHYKYPFTQTATLGGMEFDVRARFGRSDEPTKAGSDSEHMSAMLKAKGYTAPEGMMNVRLVHVDAEKRKELMVIYAEDLSGAGVTVKDLMPGGASEGKWAEMSKGLVERAKERVGVRE